MAPRRPAQSRFEDFDDLSTLVRRWRQESDDDRSHADKNEPRLGPSKLRCPVTRRRFRRCRPTPSQTTEKAVVSTWRSSVGPLNVFERSVAPPGCERPARGRDAERRAARCLELSAVERERGSRLRDNRLVFLPCFSLIAYVEVAILQDHRIAGFQPCSSSRLKRRAEPGAGSVHSGWRLLVPGRHSGPRRQHSAAPSDDTPSSDS